MFHICYYVQLAARFLHISGLLFLYISIFIFVPYLVTITFLIISQIFLGVFSIKLGLSEPVLIIGHQLVACLLVAVISALNFKGRDIDESSKSFFITESTLETCHG